MTDQELPEGFFSRLEVSKESGMGCFEILPPDAEAMPRDKEEWRKAMEIQSETRRSRPMENKSDAETRQIADLRSRISDYLRGGGLFNPELAQHHAVRDLMLDIDRVLSARLTAPSVEEVQRLYAYCIALESGCSPKHVDRARVRSGVSWIAIHTSDAESLLLPNSPEPTDGK